MSLGGGTEKKIFPPGTLVGQDGPRQFEIIKEQDGGGEAIVYKAKSLDDGRLVAIKLLWRADDAEQRRFERVKDVHKKVRGTDVLPLMQAGILKDGTDLYPYFVFPFISGGRTLEVILQEELAKASTSEKLRDTLIPYPELLHYALRAGSGLAAVHNAGVIHRDVKPSNVLVAGRGTQAIVQLMDLGISKFYDEERNSGDYKLTQEGMLRGTPAYLAPEAALGFPSVQSDIWAFGCVLYEMYTGRTAFNFENGDLRSVLAKVANGTAVPLPLHDFCIRVEPRLEKLIMHCLAYKQEDRPKDMLDVLSELNALQLALDHVSRSEYPEPEVVCGGGFGVDPEDQTMAATPTPAGSQARVSIETPVVSKRQNLEATVFTSREKKSSLARSAVYVLGLAVMGVVLYFGYQTWQSRNSTNGHGVQTVEQMASAFKPVASGTALPPAAGSVLPAPQIVLSAEKPEAGKASADAASVEPEVVDEPPKPRKKPKTAPRKNNTAGPLQPGIDYIPGLDGP